MQRGTTAPCVGVVISFADIPAGTGVLIVDCAPAVGEMGGALVGVIWSFAVALGPGAGGDVEGLSRLKIDAVVRMLPTDPVRTPISNSQVVSFFFTIAQVV